MPPKLGKIEWSAVDPSFMVLQPSTMTSFTKSNSGAVHNATLAVLESKTQLTQTPTPTPTLTSTLTSTPTTIKSLGPKVETPTCNNNIKDTTTRKDGIHRFFNSLSSISFTNAATTLTKDESLTKRPKIHDIEDIPPRDNDSKSKIKSELEEPPTEESRTLEPSSETHSLFTAKTIGLADSDCNLDLDHMNRFEPHYLDELYQHQKQITEVFDYFLSLEDLRDEFRTRNKKTNGYNHKKTKQKALPKGALLIQGPAGCGKSTFVNVVINSLGFATIKLDGTECVTNNEAEKMHIRKSLANAQTVSANGRPYVVIIDNFDSLCADAFALVKNVITTNWTHNRNLRYAPDNISTRFIYLILVGDHPGSYQVPYAKHIFLEGYSFNNVVRLVRRVTTDLGIELPNERIVDKNNSSIVRSMNAAHLLAARQFPGTPFDLFDSCGNTNSETSANLWKITQDLQIMSKVQNVWTIKDVQKNVSFSSAFCDSLMDVRHHVKSALSSSKWLQETTADNISARTACDFVFENIFSMVASKTKINPAKVLKVLADVDELTCVMDQIAAKQYNGSDSYNELINYEEVPQVIMGAVGVHLRKLQLGSIKKTDMTEKEMPLKGAYPRLTKNPENPETFLLRYNRQCMLRDLYKKPNNKNTEKVEKAEEPETTEATDSLDVYKEAMRQLVGVTPITQNIYQNLQLCADYLKIKARPKCIF